MPQRLSVRGLSVGERSFNFAKLDQKAESAGLVVEVSRVHAPLRCAEDAQDSSQNGRKLTICRYA